jgi:hypothetical protein
VRFVGGILLLLALTEIAAIFLAPDKADKICLVISPLLSAGIGSMIFWSTSRQKQR